MVKKRAGLALQGFLKAYPEERNIEMVDEQNTSIDAWLLEALRKRLGKRGPVIAWLLDQLADALAEDPSTLRAG